jgi:hypothetical protein
MKLGEVVTHAEAREAAVDCRNAAEEGRRSIPSSCAMSVWME